MLCVELFLVVPKAKIFFLFSSKKKKKKRINMSLPSESREKEERRSKKKITKEEKREKKKRREMEGGEGEEKEDDEDKDLRKKKKKKKKKSEKKEGGGGKEEEEEEKEGRKDGKRDKTSSLPKPGDKNHVVVQVDGILSSATFASLDLSNPTMQGIKELGHEKMTEVQARCIPPLLAGRDVLGAARTGSGKTLSLIHI